MRIIERLGIVYATEKAAKKAGCQKALCEDAEISETALSLFLKGHRNPPAALLAYLGYGQKTVYYKLGDK